MAKKRRPFGLRFSWLPVVKFFNPPSINPTPPISKPKPTKRTNKSLPLSPSLHLIDIIQSHATTSQPESPSPFGEANQTQAQLQTESQSRLIPLTSPPSSPSTQGGGSTQQSLLAGSAAAAGDQSPSSHLASDQPPYYLQTMSKPSSPSGDPSQYHHHIQTSSSDSNPASPQAAHQSPTGHSSPSGGPGQYYHHVPTSSSDSNPPSPQTSDQAPPQSTSPPAATPLLRRQSPSHVATQLQFTAATTVSDQPQFPSGKLESTNEENPQPLPDAATHQIQSTAVATAASQEKPNPQVFQASPQKPSRLSTGITNANFSGEPIGAESSSQTDDHRLETQPSQISGDNAKASSAITAQIMPFSESQENSGKTEEMKEAIPRELKPEEKTNRLVHGDPKQAAVSSQKTHNKDNSMDEFHSEQRRERQVEKQEALHIKEALASSHFHRLKIEPVVLTHPKVKQTASEIHQKANIYNGDQNPLHKAIQEIISMFFLKLATAQPDQALQNGKPLSVITLNGGNEGAFMQCLSEPLKKENPIHIHRISTSESFKTSTHKEESSKAKSPPKEDPATKTYINSNAQSVNNSILSNHSVTIRNPGVQLALS